MMAAVMRNFHAVPDTETVPCGRGRTGVPLSSVGVLVVEDFEPFRRFVTSTLQQKPELEVLCEVSDGMEAVQKAQELQPDLILLDIGLPKLNGIEAARRIRTVAPKSKILFLSQHRSWDIAAEALRVGASAYVVKLDAGLELLPAVEAVLLGKEFVSARLAGHDFTDTKRSQSLLGAASSAD
jgi:DNA-binding NarL/FixJ family response regulator